MIVYNLEEFAIEELFYPYMPNLIDISEMPDEEIYPFEHRKAYQLKVEEIEGKIRKDPMYIIRMLEKDISTYTMVFLRLDYIGNIKFYKWLQSPFINAVKAGMQYAMDYAKEV